MLSVVGTRVVLSGETLENSNLAVTLRIQTMTLTTLALIENLYQALMELRISKKSFLRKKYSRMMTQITLDRRK